MDQLIPIANKLQDVLGALGLASDTLDLPQIVVVGGQSSGKSSVLEALVGRSFLPRGTGIVTRRPLVLQLYNTNNCDPTEVTEAVPPDAAEWGVFLHKPDQTFSNFDRIRQEIVDETDRLTGGNKGIDSKPIHLKIFSPNVLALTLVDLPGMAKVPVGDQPPDIEQQIRDMCVEFISNPNAIILAVTSANTDLANSDALQLAQSVDPSGHRTVGVLTKLDLMDPGTDAAEIIYNRVIPLARGYIAVVNRGQKAVQSNQPVDQGLKAEEQFFRSHPVYSRDRHLLEKCGTPRLAKILNNILMHHIRDCLPDLKSRISHMMNDVQQELDALGSPVHMNRSHRGASMLKLLSKFAQNFSNLLKGEGDQADELMGGARISYIFNQVFTTSLMSVGPYDGLSDEEIRTTIINANGTRPSLFVPEVSFDILVRRQVARLEQPGVQCVDLVYEELQRIASQSEPNELVRFPNLRERLTDVVLGLLKRCVSPTQMMVSNLVKIELAYINTNHPDFIGGARAVARLMETVGKENDRASLSATTPLAQKGMNHEAYQDALAEEENSTPEQGGIMNLLFRNNRKGRVSSGGPPSIVHLPQVPDKMKQTDLPPNDRERIEVDVIKTLLDSYFMIVRKNFVDLVPKTIMYFLVNHVRDSLQNELVSELYREAEVGVLMQEAEDISTRRQTCNEMKELLHKALEIVNEVRDFNSYK